VPFNIKQQSCHPNRRVPSQQGFKKNPPPPTGEERIGLVPMGPEALLGGVEGVNGNQVIQPEDLPTFTGDALGLSVLALGCAYILVGSATPTFPKTRRGSQSPVVRIDQTNRPLIRSGDRNIFPVQSGWRIWKFGVVPVLEDDAFDASLPINQAMLNPGRFPEYIRGIESALRRSFVDAGFLPESYVP